MSDEDKYELICNPTNDEIKDMKGTSLVSEKKNIINLENSYDYTVKDFTNSVFFKIIVIIICIYIAYHLFNYIIKKILSKSNSKTSIKGGSRR
jgi:hypothetical protein